MMQQMQIASNATKNKVGGSCLVVLQLAEWLCIRACIIPSEGVAPFMLGVTSPTHKGTVSFTFK